MNRQQLIQRIKDAGGNPKDMPSLKEMEAWMSEDGGCEALDGCWVEVDGTCPHGKQSWMLVLGLS